jgi:hypothetical protein
MDFVVVARVVVIHSNCNRSLNEADVDGGEGHGAGKTLSFWRHFLLEPDHLPR